MQHSLYSLRYLCNFEEVSTSGRNKKGSFQDTQTLPLFQPNSKAAVLQALRNVGRTLDGRTNLNVRVGVGLEVDAVSCQRNELGKVKPQDKLLAAQVSSKSNHSCIPREF